MGDSVDITDFLDTDISGKLILAMSYTDLDKDDLIKFYKVAMRNQVLVQTKPLLKIDLSLTYVMLHLDLSYQIDVIRNSLNVGFSQLIRGTKKLLPL